jgi:hypothetical protein
MGDMFLSQAVSIARARMAYCESEVRRLTRFIREAEDLVGSRPVKHSASTTVEILSAAEDILARRAAPQSKGAIYDELVARGIRVPGRSPRGNLTAKFASRKDIFRFDPATRPALWSSCHKTTRLRGAANQSG